MERLDTIIIGAGQAGLAVSYHLSQLGLEHLLLERGRVAESWRSGRWDSFRIATPNVGSNLPGYPYSGADAEGFMTRDELIAFFGDYASSFGPPLRCGVTVDEVSASGDGYRVTANGETLLARNVVVATGILQSGRVPPVAQCLPRRLHQVHSCCYRNPDALPPGGVLVVGSGLSGTQIADELHHAGRAVTLSVGSNGRVPRRYRGRDIMAWVGQAKLHTKRFDKFSQHAHISEPGPHDLSLHALAARGVRLVGHLEGVQGERASFSADVAARLASADQFEADFLKAVDAFILEAGLDVPEEPPREPSRTEVTEVAAFNLAGEGITVVLWATGYSYDFSWVKPPVLDAAGAPLQERGVTACPGLYFVGMNWLVRPFSAFVGNVGAEAEVVAGHIAARVSSTAT
jgi:putative flavoprotein involved in K+ transport